MEYPQLAVMNISHRYFDLEEFFSSAAASGYTCCELWTGAMHLYVDCHGYDSLEQVRELSAVWGSDCGALSRTEQPQAVEYRGARE